jgi:16S rRNA (cytosine967-C5)-methyltransferase
VPDTWNEGLSSDDAALAQAILGLCLRNWGRLQAWVRPRLKNPDRDIPLGSRVALAMGLAQLAWLPGVLTHAAVNESVLLASDPELGFPPHKGLVNALLRQASKDRPAFRIELEAFPCALDRTAFADRALGAALAPWPQADQTEILWKSLQQPSRPSFRSLTCDPLPEGLEPDPDFPLALRLAPDASFPRAWLAGGCGMVQDLSSQAMMAFEWHG